MCAPTGLNGHVSTFVCVCVTLLLFGQTNSYKQMISTRDASDRSTLFPPSTRPDRDSATESRSFFFFLPTDRTLRARDPRRASLIRSHARMKLNVKSPVCAIGSGKIATPELRANVVRFAKKKKRAGTRFDLPRVR